MKLSYLSDVKWEWNTRHDPGCFRALMERYWNTLLVTCGGVVFLSVAFAAWTALVPLSAPEPVGEIGKDTTETLSREQMKATLELFKGRKDRYDERKVQPTNIVDPA
jgi:hypothetical protein